MFKSLLNLNSNWHQVPSSMVDRGIATISPTGEQIFADQVRLLFRLGSKATLGVLLNAMLVAVVFRSVVPTATLLIWLGAILVITVARYSLARWYLRGVYPDRDERRWYALHYFGMVLSAACWGITPWLFVTAEKTIYQMFLIFVLAGMAAGSVAVLSAVRSAAVSYVIIVITPLTVLLFLAGTEQHLAMAVMTVVFMVLVIGATFRVNELITTSLELRYQNFGLVSEVRKKNQELLEKNQQLDHALNNARAAAQAKTEFLANMSHEMRTPLNGVLGMIELLDTTEQSPDQREYLALAKSSGQGLREVIDSVLDFSKVEAGKVQLEMIPFSVRELVENLSETFVPLANSKPIELITSIDSSVPELIVSDPTRLKQILQNLISNAIKFTQAGHVLVEVRVASTNGSKTELEFAINDTGIGISEERQQNLFEAFYQVDASVTRRFGGTGLGLAISRQLAEALGGSLAVQSLLGRGSTFILRATFECDNSWESRKLKVPAPAPRVGLVCDNPTARETLVRYISELGCEPQSTPALPISAALADSDTIVVYSSAPESGLGERLLAIRQSSPLPLIVISGLPVLAFGEASRDVLNVQRIRKPARIIDVRAAILDRGTPLQPTGDFQRPTTSSPQIAGIRALVVDDNKVNQTVAVKLLERLGISCDTATNGIEAVQTAESNHYDLILMDCQMPHMDGFSATRELRRTYNKLGVRVPIIAMTASALDEDRRQCLDAGMDDHLPKPIDRAELERIVSRYCTGR